jgi:hypothetical protein
MELGSIPVLVECTGRSIDLQLAEKTQVSMRCGSLSDTNSKWSNHIRNLRMRTLVCSFEQEALMCLGSVRLHHLNPPLAKNILKSISRGLSIGRLHHVYCHLRVTLFTVLTSSFQQGPWEFCCLFTDIS